VHRRGVQAVALRQSKALHAEGQDLSLLLM